MLYMCITLRDDMDELMASGRINQLSDLYHTLVYPFAKLTCIY